MIVLDTNVVSEMMRATEPSAVMDWLNETPASQLYTTAITVAEISQGIAQLPPGARRTRLESAASVVFQRFFQARVLPFDHHAALRFGRLVAARRAMGKPVQFPDAAIAAIALRHDATVATRDIADFSDLGVPLVNPWDLPREM